MAWGNIKLPFGNQTILGAKLLQYLTQRFDETISQI
jgi:hypothetical protein